MIPVRTYKNQRMIGMASRKSKMTNRVPMIVNDIFPEGPVLSSFLGAFFEAPIKK